MLLTEFDEKDYLEGVREEGERKGREEGEQQKIIDLIVKKVKKEKTLATIAKELEEDETVIEPLYNAVIASAPDYCMEEIKKRL